MSVVKMHVDLLHFHDFMVYSQVGDFLTFIKFEMRRVDLEDVLGIKILVFLSPISYMLCNLLK